MRWASKIELVEVEGTTGRDFIWGRVHTFIMPSDNQWKKSWVHDTNPKYDPAILRHNEKWGEELSDERKGLRALK